MPNGHRYPYRLHPECDSPSPLHTSDSEETYEHKQRYRILGLRVIRRWRRFVKMQRYKRAIYKRLCLVWLGLKERKLDTHTIVNILAYLGLKHRLADAN